MSPALQALLFYQQFILYKLVPSRKNIGKTDKFPINHATMEIDNAHNPAIWTSYDNASAIAKILGKEYGVGFVFTADDPFFFLDIDHCIDKATGAMSDIAANLLAALPSAAVETSQSGEGLHIFGMAEKMHHSCKNTPLGIELYTEGRFAALTDRDTYGNVATECTVNLQAVVSTYFPPSVAIASEDWRDVPVPEWKGSISDDDLLAKAMKSRSAASAFGNKATFAQIFNNDTDALALAYGTLNDKDPYDRSSADAALAQHLAFWTGKNHDRIRRIMLMSQLKRDKWDWHKNYLTMTITNAVNNQRDVLGNRPDPTPPVAPTTPTTPASPTPPVAPITPTSPTPPVAPTTPAGSPVGLAPASDTTMTAGVQFMPPTQQVEYFKGCVYVRDHHRIFVPDGSRLKPEQFKSSYGGYTFSLDTLNEKTTKNAWECFTESQAFKFPWVHNICFRPELATGTVVEEEGKRYVNTYTAINTDRRAGDVAPFLNHLAKILPTPRDQEIILAYMASLVQNIGTKFQWSPFIQGTEGNGKSLLARVLTHCVGHRYTHYPNPAELGSGGMKFNGWIAEKLFIAIEEIFTSDKREITEPLKVMITNERIEIQFKGGDQYTGDNRANFMLFSNHKDALTIKIDGRRYCVMYCAQQSYADMVRDGMVGDYFPKLYEWLKTGGYAHINDFLHNYAIPDELNPATSCQRAPATDSLNEAVSLSMGVVEGEILEAVNEGRVGFRPPFISSMALDILLKNMGRGRVISRNKRKEMLTALGYIPHPALPSGRLNKVVVMEQGKPRIYVKDDAPERNFISGADVYDSYMASQGYTAGVKLEGEVVVPIARPT